MNKFFNNKKINLIIYLNQTKTVKHIFQFHLNLSTLPNIFFLKLFLSYSQMQEEIIYRVLIFYLFKNIHDISLHCSNKSFHIHYLNHFSIGQNIFHHYYKTLLPFLLLCYPQISHNVSFHYANNKFLFLNIFHF